MDLKKFIYKYILKRKYYRYGKCNRCGDCCCKIHVKHQSKVLKDEQEFEKLKKQHRFYLGLEIIDKDEDGLVFRCKNFDKEKRICKIHKYRSSICRKYPNEEMFKFGGIVGQNCGYSFKPIESFAQVFEKISKKNKLP